MREKERPKNFAKTVIRLLGYFREQWYTLPIIVLLSLGATVAALVGPFLIGRVIDGLVYPLGFLHPIFANLGGGGGKPAAGTQYAAVFV
jgi:hypothetical protein